MHHFNPFPCKCEIFFWCFESMISKFFRHERKEILFFGNLSDSWMTADLDTYITNYKSISYFQAHCNQISLRSLGLQNWQIYIKLPHEKVKGLAKSGAYIL